MRDELAVGGGLVVVGIASQSLIQHATSDEFQARVISVYFALTFGVLAIGVLVRRIRRVRRVLATEPSREAWLQEDVADWAKQEFGGTVTLHSSGPRLSVSARLAAVQTKAIASVEMEQPMKSLKEVITANKGANHLPELMCHGLLEIFDLEQIKELNQ